MVRKKHFYIYYSYEPWGRGYIGKRECWCLPEEDINYFGSFSDKTFIPTEKIILLKCETLEEAFEFEILLQEFFSVDKNPQFANIYVHRSKNFCNNGNQIIKDKISKALTGIKRSEETKKKISISKKGTVLTEEHRKKISEKRKGKKPSLGMKHTEDHKKEQSERMKKNNPFKGKTHTEETKRKISEVKKGKVAHNKGKTHTEETKRKISEIRKRQCELKKLQQKSGGN